MVDGDMKLRTLFPYPCNNEIVGHTAFSLARHLSGTDLHAELWVMTRGPRARARFVRTPLPRKVLALIHRANRLMQPESNWVRWMLERRYAGAFREGDAAHVFRGCSLELVQSLRARGHVVFLERVNTMDHMARRIIEDAFARAGWPAEHFYTQAVLDRQQAQAEAASFVISPSPAVTESLLERGIPEERILKSSYGWDPERFRTAERALPEIDGATVLFVGSIGMRKGAHLLLKAWSKARIDGRLVLAGPVEPLIAKYCADLLSRGDVIHLPYDPNVARVYRSADIFAFPTLEEGSALVTYEAIGNGLPVVTSPMGAGSVIRDGKEGLVVDPHETQQLVAALRDLAGDAEKRRAMGERGRARAAEYTWQKVAQRRYELMRKAMSGVGPVGGSHSPA